MNGEIQFGKKTYPACLYSEHDDPKKLIITGWGKTSTGKWKNFSNDENLAYFDLISLKQLKINYVLMMHHEIHHHISINALTITSFNKRQLAL